MDLAGSKKETDTFFPRVLEDETPSLPVSQYTRQERDDILQSSGIIGAEKQALVERFPGLYCITELETYLSYLAVPCILLPRKPNLPPASPIPSAPPFSPTRLSLSTIPGFLALSSPPFRPSPLALLSSPALVLFRFSLARLPVFLMFPQLYSVSSRNFSTSIFSALPTLQAFISFFPVTLSPLPQNPYVSSS